MIQPIDLLKQLHAEADEAVEELAAAKHLVQTIEYWKGRRDGIAYAIRELQQATGSVGGEDFLTAAHVDDFSNRLGDQLRRDHEKHRTVESDHERMD